jgi:hypothetical protein
MRHRIIQQCERLLVIVARVAVVVTMAEQTLAHVNVVTIAVTRFNKAVQVWVQGSLGKVVNLLDQYKLQHRYQQAGLIHRQSLDTFNGNSRTIKSIKRNQ